MPENNKDDKTRMIEEGIIKKGGLNPPPPLSSIPDQPPQPQAPADKNSVGNENDK